MTTVLDFAKADGVLVDYPTSAQGIMDLGHPEGLFGCTAHQNRIISGCTAGAGYLLRPVAQLSIAQLRPVLLGLDWHKGRRAANETPNQIQICIQFSVWLLALLPLCWRSPRRTSLSWAMPYWADDSEPRGLTLWQMRKQNGSPCWHQCQTVQAQISFIKQTLRRWGTWLGGCRFWQQRSGVSDSVRHAWAVQVERQWLRNPYCSYISNFEVFSTSKGAILEQIMLPLFLTIIFYIKICYSAKKCVILDLLAVIFSSGRASGK